MVKSMSSSQYKMQYLDEVYENLTALGRQKEADEKEASVFLSRHKSTGKIVAKKYVDADRVAVYEKLSRIEDIHLERVYEYAVYGKQGLILMDYISGMTLQELMEEGKTFSEKEVFHMAVELCTTLQKVHRAGIVHRDINPENIMISNDGVLKLIDFGIAREKKKEQAKDTAILGTPGYAAPEQFGFSQTDGRADIYAVGVLLNVLLTGSLPGEKLYDGFPFNGIIKHCIEIDAKQRFQSVGELLEDLYGKGKEYCETADSIEKRNWKSNAVTVKGTYVSKWLPGFRTGFVWKNVVAVIGYFLMILVTAISIEDCTQSWYAIILETAAIFLYLWGPFLLVANIAYWDRKWIFAKMPRVVMIIVRIILALVFFYNGIMLESYVRYELLGMVRK